MKRYRYTSNKKDRLNLAVFFVLLGSWGKFCGVQPQNEGLAPHRFRFLSQRKGPRDRGGWGRASALGRVRRKVGSWAEPGQVWTASNRRRRRPRQGRSRFRPAGGSGASPLVCQLNADRLPPLPPAVSKKKQASLLIFIYCLKIPRITSVTNPTINRPVKICSKCSRTYPQTKMQSTAHMTAFINFFILRSPPKMNRNFHLFFFVDDEIKTGQNSVLFLFHHLIITIFVPTASMSTMNVCVSSYPKSGAKRL